MSMLLNGICSKPSVGERRHLGRGVTSRRTAVSLTALIRMFLAFRSMLCAPCHSFPSWGGWVCCVHAAPRDWFSELNFETTPEIRKNEFSFVPVSNVQPTLSLDVWRNFASLFYLWANLKHRECQEEQGLWKKYSNPFNSLSGYFETLQWGDLGLCISFAVDKCPSSMLPISCELAGVSGLELCSSWMGSGLRSTLARPNTAVPSRPVPSHHVLSHHSSPLAAGGLAKQLQGAQGGPLVSKLSWTTSIWQWRFLAF